MENIPDFIRSSDIESTSDNMSYLFGRDPSILAYGQRPIPSSRQNLISLYEDEEHEFTDDTASDSLTLQTVKVYLRLKPLPRKLKLTKEELAAYEIPNSTTLVTKLPSLDHNTSALKGPKTADTICRNFTFTQTFGPETTQLHLFEQVIQQKMVDFLAGQNSTVMTYGTTNSGKSYTLQGTTTSPGIIPRGLEFVFSNITARPTPLYKPLHNSDVVSLNAVDRAQELECKNKLLTFGSIDKHHYINAYKQMQKLLQEESPIRASQACDAQYSVWVSFAEIYNENIYDLLSNECHKRRPLLKLCTDNNGRAFIKGLKSICVNSGSEAYQVLMAGQYNLKVAATALNARSSRSHCIFTIKLLKYYIENSPEQVEVSTFAFCDLAGSERLKKTLNVGERLKEAQNINTSLLVLGRCLKSIYENQTIKSRSINEHVGPFRESKLTRLFQQALSGKEQIALIVNVNPIPNLYVETQNVLNFSAIAKKIVVEPKQIKCRVARSRFSQIVAQSGKSSPDWDENETSEMTEHTATSYVDPSVLIHADEFEDLIAQNKTLKKEIGVLKASMLKRDLEIRQELADTYTSMMQKLETDWKNRIRDVEEQQEDHLAWSVKRVETFYEEKISELTSRKRRRQHGDDSDEEGPDISELQIENSRLMANIHSLKKTIKKMRENNENVNAEKNKVAFELGLANDELKSVKSLLSSAQDDLSKDDDGRMFIEKLRTELNEKQAHIKRLKKFLDEAKDEYISITSHAGAMEIRVKEHAEELAESREHVADLEELLEQVNACLAEKTKRTEVLEEKLSIQSNLLSDSKIREENLQANLIDSKETIRQLKDKLAILEKTHSSPKSITPDSMLADVEIKEEVLSECESETSLGNQKPVFHEGIVIKTDNEILGIPVTSYDDDGDSEVFVAVQEISENEKSDRTESVTELKEQLINLKTENETLKRKCEQSQLEIDLVREKFAVVKRQMSDVNKQLDDYKIVAAMSNEIKKLEVSLSQKTSEWETPSHQPDYQTTEVQRSDNGCESAALSGQDQKRQTSFTGPESVDKSIQATIIDVNEIVNIRKQLGELMIKYEDLEADLETKVALIASLRVQIENDVNQDELEKLRTKYDQLKAECQTKKQIEEDLTNNSSEEELKQLKTKNDQLEAECQEIKTLMEKLQKERDEVRESSSSLQEKLNHDLQSLKMALALAVADKETTEKTLFEKNELLTALERQIIQCRDEHESKITTLEKEVIKVQEETKLECLKVQTDKIAEMKSSFTLETKKLEDKITEMLESIDRCQIENKLLQKKLLKNATEIETLEKRCQIAAKKEKEKDEEIEQLQKALKKHLIDSAQDKKELNDAKETLSQIEEKYNNHKTNSKKELNACDIKIAQLQENERLLEIIKKEAKEDITRINKENEELKTLMDDKDREMVSFMKNRDDMIAKFETLVKDKQEELELAKREITKLQENLHRKIPTTPRDRGTKPADESLKVPIPVVDLSDSETKRTTRRTALAPPSSCSSSDMKRNTRKKRLYNPVEDSCIDLEVGEPVPPTPSPSTSTRSLRTRRK